MNDKELADKVVALGLFNALKFSDGEDGGYQISSDPLHQTTQSAGNFVRDWRVAGALMEKCVQGEFRTDDGSWFAGATVDDDHAYYDEYDNSANNALLPRAIIEACVEALS